MKKENKTLMSDCAVMDSLHQIINSLPNINYYLSKKDYKNFNLKLKVTIKKIMGGNEVIHHRIFR